MSNNLVGRRRPSSCVILIWLEVARCTAAVIRKQKIGFIVVISARQNMSCTVIWAEKEEEEEDDDG